MALFQSQLCSTFQQQNSASPGCDAIAQLNLQEYISGQRNRRQPTGRDSSICTQAIWIFFWLLVLVTLAYPIGLIAGLFYVFLVPFSLIGCFKPVTEMLLKGLNFPLTCAENMVQVKQLIIM